MEIILLWISSLLGLIVLATIFGALFEDSVNENNRKSGFWSVVIIAIWFVLLIICGHFWRGVCTTYTVNNATDVLVSLLIFFAPIIIGMKIGMKVVRALHHCFSVFKKIFA